MFQQGVDLRTWINAGIDRYQAEIAKSEKATIELPLSENGHRSDPQPQIPPSLDEAIRGQKHQLQALAPEPLLDVVKEGKIAEGYNGNGEPESAAVEDTRQAPGKPSVRVPPGKRVFGAKADRRYSPRSNDCGDIP